FVTLDASEFVDLGTVTFTDTFPTLGQTIDDANIQLSFAGGAATTVDVSGTTGIGDELRVNFAQTGQTAGQDVTIDFSPIVRGTVNSLLTYTGGAADEMITGTAGDDSINASGGQNSVTGGVGNDTLRADSGFSTLDGGLGDDSIAGSSLSGLLSGGAGDDTITQSTGRFESGAYQAVEITGGDDDDTISVTSVQGTGSTVRGDAGNDTILLNFATMTDGFVDGGTGVDQLSLSGSNMTGTDFEGIDATTILNNSTNTIDGAEFADLGTVTFTDTFATVGSTSIDANVSLNFAGGATTTVDVSGTTAIGDELRVSFTNTGQTAGQSVTIDFSPIARGTVNSVLSYTGGVADEDITGTAGADVLNPGSGINTVDGGAGDDTINGASGSGVVRGGAGDDSISQSFGYFLSGAYVAVEIDGGQDDDTIAVSSVQGDGSTVAGGAGDDSITLTGVTMRDGLVDGGLGADSLVLSNSFLEGTDFEGIEQTLISNSSFIRLDANEVVDLGALTITDQFGGTTADANISLAVYGNDLADFSNLNLGENENILITTLNSGPSAAMPFDVTVDLSGVTRTGDQLIRFANNVAHVRSEVIASSGDDSLGGGARSDDTLSYQASDAAVTVNLQAETVAGGWAEGDIISGFENVIGSNFGDTLTGRNAAFGTDFRADNVITGFGGDDIITTGTGNDTVVATVDNGDDTITDFTNGSDRVDLRELPRDAAIVAFLTASDAGGGDTLLTFSSGGSMLLEGLAFGDYDIGDVILEDGVYALDEVFTTDEDSVLTGNVIAANQPFGFTDLEIDGQVSLGSGNLSVVDFTVGGMTFLAGQTATLGSGATLTVAASGAFTYDGTAAASVQALSELLSESLLESFTYTVQSSLTLSTDEGAVEIDVQAVNDAPVIAGDVTGAVTEDGANLMVDLLGQASDVDNGDVLTVVNGAVAPAGTSLSGNTLTIDADAATFQDLNAGETREIVYTYDVQDLFGAITSGATARITVTGVNDAPTLTGATMVANEDGASVDLGLATLGDDADGENDGTTLTYAVVTQPGEGSASISGTTLTFDPGADFQDLAAGETRDVTIQIQATDDRSATSTIEDVVVTVTGANDAPSLTGATMAASEDGASVDLALAPLGDDADGENDGTSLTYAVVTQPGEGSAAISGTTLTFDPGADFQDLAAGETRDVTIQIQATDFRSATSTIE
ncbi:MAG: Ig-like domain-containing protein, partial [Jannaschia sp.]